MHNSNYVELYITAIIKVGFLNEKSKRDAKVNQHLYIPNHVNYAGVNNGMAIALA
jgi:hypothetical protein